MSVRAGIVLSAVLGCMAIVLFGGGIYAVVKGVSMTALTGVFGSASALVAIIPALWAHKPGVATGETEPARLRRSGQNRAYRGGSPPSLDRA